MPVFFFYLALSGLVCLAMTRLPGIVFVLAVIWGMLLILAGLKTNRVQLAVIFIINIVLLYLAAGNTEIMLYGLYIGLPAFVMGILSQDEKRKYNDLRQAGIGAAIIAIMLLAGTIYLTGGTAGINQVEHQLKIYIQQSLNGYESTGAFQMYTQKGISRHEVEAVLYTMAHLIAQHLPAFYTLQSILMVVLALYLASLWTRHNGSTRLRKSPFSLEIMPWWASWLVIAGIGLYLMGKQDSIIRLIGSNLLVIMVPILVYFGLSLLSFVLGRSQGTNRKWAIVMAIIIFVSFPLPVIILLALMGVFDSLVDYRKLRQIKEES